MSTENQNSKTALIIAIITVLGTLGSALFANWDKIFSGKPITSPVPSVTPTTPPPKTINSRQEETPTKLVPLKKYLSSKNWAEADLATDFLQPKSLSCSELLSVNKLWLEYSDNNFGYSVQRRIWNQHKLSGKYINFAEFVGWKRDNTYAFNIHDSIMITGLDASTQAPLGHLPFNGWQVNGNNFREGFDAFMIKLAQCKI
jgi:GUN4-like